MIQSYRVDRRRCLLRYFLPKYGRGKARRMEPAKVIFGVQRDSEIRKGLNERIWTRNGTLTMR